MRAGDTIDDEIREEARNTPRRANAYLGKRVHLENDTNAPGIVMIRPRNTVGHPV